MRFRRLARALKGFLLLILPLSVIVGIGFGCGKSRITLDQATAINTPDAYIIFLNSIRKSEKNTFERDNAINKLSKFVLDSNIKNVEICYLFSKQKYQHYIKLRLESEEAEKKQFDIIKNYIVTELSNKGYLAIIGEHVFVLDIHTYKGQEIRTTTTYSDLTLSFSVKRNPLGDPLGELYTISADYRKTLYDYVDSFLKSPQLRAMKGNNIDAILLVTIDNFLIDNGYIFIDGKQVYPREVSNIEYSVHLFDFKSNRRVYFEKFINSTRKRNQLTKDYSSFSGPYNYAIRTTYIFTESEPDYYSRSASYILRGIPPLIGQ